MSAINSISNLNNLYPAVGELASSLTSPNTSATANSISGTVTASPSTLAGALHAGKGKHPKLGGALFKKIEQSVTSALQSAGPTADPNKVVQDAIAKVLTSGNASSTSAAQDADDTSDGTQQMFAQTLQAYGITPDQFRSDLTAALQNAKSANSTGPSLSSFPPGLFIDTAA